MATLDTPAPRAARFHYAWVVAGVVFFALLTSAGTRAAAGVLIKPLEAEFGWDRASVSFAIAVSILTFGFGAPLGGMAIDRFGLRKVVVGGLGLVAVGLTAMLAMAELWHFTLVWGLVVGMGTGAVANVIGATVSFRWFKVHRGLVVGLLSSASSMGQLIFLPSLMGLTLIGGWRLAVGVVAAFAAALLIPVLLWLRNRPEDVGLRPYGDDGTTTAAERREEGRKVPMRQAVRTVDFWLLAGSFFVCGYTTNGMVGTHLIPHAVEHGFTEVTAASAVALMGVMNVVGTLASGWLTDRVDSRKLLACYYGFRALSLAALPFILDVPYLLVFAVVYGLDWIATVPPTTQLTARIFGRESLATVYGWIFFAHMVGAALAAYIGGFFRYVVGDYHGVFISAAFTGIVAVALVLRINPALKLAPAPAAA